MVKRRKINIFRCVFVCLLLFFFVEVIKQEVSLYRLNNEIDATKARMSELVIQHKKLQEEQQNINDPKYIEKIAREEYNMVKKEEIPVFVKE